MIVPAIRRMARPVEELTVHPRNDHHQGDVGAICQSLERFGQVRPILVQKSTGYVVAGNHVLLAARALGWPKVAAVVTEMSDEDALAYLVADNRLPQLGTFDDQGMADLLGDLVRDGGLGGTGYDDEDYSRLLDDIARDMSGGGPDPDATPEPPADPVSRLGEAWNIGPHRLICGDACDADVVGEVLGGEVPRVLLTDPPYGVGVDHRWREGPGSNLNRKGSSRADILNDDRADWREALVISKAPVAYLWHGGAHAVEAYASLEAAGYEIRQQIIWKKPMAPISRSHYHWQHEPCWYAVRKGATAGWHGDRKQTTVWEVSSPLHIMSGGIDKAIDPRTEHPTQKPVDLYERPIRNHTVRGDLVYDPFSGTGSALIAAERLGRRCCVVELDPRWCDVIRQRYADFVADQSFAPS